MVDRHRNFQKLFYLIWKDLAYATIYYRDVGVYALTEVAANLNFNTEKE